MKMSTNVYKLDRAAWLRLKPVDQCASEKSSSSELSNSSPMTVPLTLCKPITDQQFQDYQTLIAEAKALIAMKRHQEAKRVRQIAADILRTGAPSLG